MKKKLLSTLTALSLTAALCAGCSTPAEPTPSADATPSAEATPSVMTAGTYQGTAAGMKGDLTVEVTVDESKILSVEVIDCVDTTGIKEAAIATLPDSIVEHQSYMVDGVAGATMTSWGIKNAVSNALKAAGADLSQFKTAPAKTEKTAAEAQSYDVVVVGSGMAGLSAAIEIARNSSLSVLVLEKEAYTGGSTRLCGGGLWAINSSANEVMGQDSTLEEYIGFMEKQGGVELNRTLMSNIYDKVDSVITYYLENGMPVGTDGWSLGHPDSQLPVLWSTNGSNSEHGIVESIQKMAEDLGVEIRLNSKVTELVHDTSSVSGVMVEDLTSTYQINAQKVILATGGFTRNRELIEELAPEYVDVIPFTGAGSDGDGFTLTEDFDINIVGEGMMGLSGTTATNGYYFNSGTMVWGPQIVVNTDGEEFGMSGAFYGDTLKLMVDQGGEVYGIFDSASWAAESMDSFAGDGSAFKYDSLSELAAAHGINTDTLAETVANAEMSAEGPYYCLVIHPVFIGSIPGLEVDANCRVLTSDGNAIENLYACGELIFGNVFNRAYPSSGTGVGTSAYTGAIAGEAAYTDLNK